jgi:isochorismate pyruvate lyase
MMGRGPAVVALVAAAALAGASARVAAEDAKAYWGEPSVDGGKCCKSLSEVRENIDRIDRDLVRLMAERQKYVAEAGRFKANPSAVSAPARVEQVIEKVKTLAREEGLAETVAEKTFRAMIAGFEDYEREVWTERNANSGGEEPAKTP